LTGATVMPSPASSPRIRRYPRDSFSRASRSTADRTLRRIGGRPGRRRRDRGCPPPADDVGMPAQDGPGRHDEPQCPEALAGQRTGEQRQPCAVWPRHPGMSAGPLAHGYRKLMTQHQDLGVLPPRLPARQAQQRDSTGHDDEDQLQACKPEIIARPDRPERFADAACAQVAQVFGTHRAEKVAAAPAGRQFSAQPGQPSRLDLACRYRGMRACPAGSRDDLLVGEVHAVWAGVEEQACVVPGSLPDDVKLAVESS
jgi:hypothetical protein